MPAVNKADSQLNPFLLDDVLNVSRYNLPARLFKSGMENVLGLRYLADQYSKLEPAASPREFVQQCFARLNIDHAILSGQLENIPATGPALVVANHPFGAVEGLLMVMLLMQRRSDVRIMANGFLRRIPELQDVLLGVNPYRHRAATRQNVSAMRECVRWLKRGGLVFVFPAGDVSSIQLQQLAIVDGEWDSSIARLAVMTDASVLPIHIHGRNSASFYLAGLIHPFLKTLLLPRQLINKSNSTIRLRIGRPVAAASLARLASEQEMIAYLRLRTYLLSNQQEQRQTGNDKLPSQRNRIEAVIQPVATDLLVAEVKSLPASQLLGQTGNLQVYHARAVQIPWLLQEIGRLREISFREVGEGTGKDVDIDVYDRFYRHLFVWDTETQQLVGAYRLGLVDEILPYYGMSGLYSYSLFRYNRSFLQQLGPAIELGRSFVRREYQKNFTPLMLLWKGISRFVALHPQYVNLFGPVSISNEYETTSQQLLIKFLQENLSEPRLARHVRPRRPYRPTFVPGLDKDTTHCNSLEELSSLIAGIEHDEKGVPVLIRQYLKMGGRLLGFNIDPAFNNCVDGLIKVDMSQVTPKLLAKYMGQSEAAAYLAYHQSKLAIAS